MNIHHALNWIKYTLFLIYSSSSLDLVFISSKLCSSSCSTFGSGFTSGFASAAYVFTTWGHPTGGFLV